MRKNDCVVAMHYTLTDNDGKVIDESGDTPLEYLQGHNNIIAGLEKAMEGRKKGDKFKVSIPPEEAYGAYEKEMCFEMSRKELGNAGVPKVGMMAKLATDQGDVIASITKVTDEIVVFDANHPLAGKTLNFEVEVADVREATPEELKAGHIGGCGCHCDECGGCG